MDNLVDSLMDIHFNGSELYQSKKISKNNYNIIFSDFIDDTYWNFAYLKNDNADNFDNDWAEIKNIMNNYNRQPLLYITSALLSEDIQRKVKENHFKKLYTEVWMIIDDLASFENYKSKIDVHIEKVDNKLKEKFINAVIDGFSGNNPDDPYEPLSQGYRISLEKSFEAKERQYKVLHYLGMHQNNAVSTVTVVYKDDKALVYNVTTNKAYKRNGICKYMMSQIINDLKEKGIKVLCLQTEQGFYTEQVYKSMRFKEIMLGSAYMEGGK